MVTNARAFYTTRAAAGATGTRLSLRPLFFEAKDLQNSGASRGETAKPWLQMRLLERGWFDLFRRVSKEQLKHDEIRLIRKGNGSALPLPPNSGLPELGIQYCRSRIYPTSSGRGLG